VNDDDRQRPADGNDEALPFDVELERLPAWVHVSSALVILVSVLVATRLVHMLVLLPFLVASSLGRRFASSTTHVEVDGNGLDLGGRAIPRSEIVDVWVDDDRTEPRVTVAFGADVVLAVLHFQNPAQAKRFGEALDDQAEPRAMVVGHRPRPVDLLASLRFVAIAAAFFGTGSVYGLFALAFFAFGAWTVVQAKQVIATARGFEVRSVLGIQSYGYADVESVDTEAGVIALKGGREISLHRSSLRDTTLATAGWLERARTRVLERIRTAR
jgi:hypothetical protein